MRGRVDKRMRERCGVEKEEKWKVEWQRGRREKGKQRKRWGRKRWEGKGDRREREGGRESYGGREGRKRWGKASLLTVKSALEESCMD